MLAKAAAVVADRSNSNRGQTAETSTSGDVKTQSFTVIPSFLNISPQHSYTILNSVARKVWRFFICSVALGINNGLQTGFTLVLKGHFHEINGYRFIRDRKVRKSQIFL